jgi:hypothetical protein
MGTLSGGYIGARAWNWCSIIKLCLARSKLCDIFAKDNVGLKLQITVGIPITPEEKDITDNKDPHGLLQLVPVVLYLLCIDTRAKNGREETS